MSSALVLIATGCGSQPTAGAGKGAAPAANQKAPAQSGPLASADGGRSASAAPTSVFQPKLATARNPFFPHLTRSEAKAAEAAAIPRMPTVSYLKLLGIRPGTARPMALINRTPFAPGEEGPVSIVLSNQVNKAETQKISIRCLEIRRDSVLISIAGEDGVKELRMAQAK